MDQKRVTQLERALEAAIAAALSENPQLPHAPSGRTIHFMAKAAVTVYEAAEAATRDNH